MKKQIKNIFSGIVLLSILLSGCNDYFDLNDNPNQVSDPPINSLLSTATSKTGLNSQRVAAFTSYFVQHIANPGAGGSSDTYQPTDYTGTWDAIYFAMADIYDMKQKAIKVKSSAHLGVSNVLLAYHLALITDLWGAAPYTEAFTAVTLTPKYDSEEQLYTTINTLLDQAIIELAKPNSAVNLKSGDDLIFAGDLAKWTKFAYMLKARHLNKISKKTTYSADAVLSAASKSFKSNDDDAKMGVFQNRNPWASVAISNTQLVLGGWLSEQLMDALNGKTYGVIDPRIAKITDKTVNNDYKGTPNGTGNIGPAANTVRDETYISVNSPVTSPTSPLIIASYSELKFIEAEAAFRKGGSELTRAYAAYRDGIIANMDKLGVSTADQTAYLASSAVAGSSAALTLDIIFKEKYITTFLNPETWNDARRYDYKYKDFTLPVGASLITFIRRIDYPDGEKSKNGANVPAPVPLTDKLYWDK